MLAKVQDIVNEATANLTKKLGFKTALVVTDHFEKRITLRFFDEELPLLEKSIESAFKACLKSERTTDFRFTSQYGFTIACDKIGKNGITLVSCWKQGKEDWE